MINERLSSGTGPEQVASPHESPRTPYAAPDRETPDWRRLEVASHRFAGLIARGITTAIEQRADIANGTARCIAHVLGRGLGRQSALAHFGRTSEGDYEPLREEHLALYSNADITEPTKDLIHWLGTYLIRQQHPNARSATYHETYPPRLDTLLVPTGVEVGDWYLTVQVPGIYDSAAIEELTNTLTELAVDEDAALRTFLGLPDVNAMSGDIMTDFHENYVGTYASVEDALQELAEIDEREREVTEYAAERRLVIETVSPEYEALLDDITDGYDFVEQEGRVYVFHK